MTISTDLSVSPYFDDYNETKDFYKILFRPGVAVQVRELNQLQTILQKQIERFGDNVFKRGTIVDGCDIKFHDVFPYVKIKDNQADGAPVNVSQLTRYYVRNQANLSPLIAQVTITEPGFESRNPDLNTLYVSYKNSGYANVGSVRTEVNKFAADEILTVYDPAQVIESVISTNDSTGFSNTDTVVFTSAIGIQNSTGGTTFANNFFVNDEIRTGSANLSIISIDTTTNTSIVILKVRPLITDLLASNTSKYTISANDNIQSANVTPSSVANVVQVIGSGATASLVTGQLGEVDAIVVTGKGSGYYILPSVTIASNTANSTQISTVALAAQNFLTQVTVANTSTIPVGTGYGMSVGTGVIYQKGFFSRVSPQLIVVEKYANTPDAKSVGFSTSESIVNSNQDTSLLDNVTGGSDVTAPGANRFKLDPRLVVFEKAQADANSEFLYLAEFSRGAPYKQNRQTVYNVLGDELARRSFEESGNYVIDQFNLNTKSAPVFANESNTFNIAIDPGVAYISGHRVATVRNFETAVDKGIDTLVANSATVTMNYGNYIRVNQLGGQFKFSVGAQVSLYSTARTYIANGVGASVDSSLLGTLLGKARMRSLVLDSGTPGTPEAVYRLYLFDVRGEVAKNFSNARSILYDGTSASFANGVADVVLTNGNAVINDNNNTSLLFSPGVKALKNANNITYTYRTVSTANAAVGGTITIGLSGPGESFPYTPGGTLSSIEERDLIVVPLANAQISANLAGGITCNTTSSQVNGTSTAFTTNLVAGDFIKVANSTANVVLQVNSVISANTLTVRGTPSAAITGNATIFFPANIPVSLERATRTSNVNVGGTTLTINLGGALEANATTSVAYNVRSANTPSQPKTIQRNRYIRINCANNVAGNTGPWSLGVPDVCRLRKVLSGPNTTFTQTDTVNVTDVTSLFYVDHNQREDYYDNSLLVKKPNTTALSNTAILLVQYDAFSTTTEGVKTVASYPINDTLPLANSSSTINTLEIPEMYNTKGEYFDLRDQVDARPMCVNSVALFASANSTTPINPPLQSAATLLGTDDKKFPAPGSVLTTNCEYYLGRTDRVIVDQRGNFALMRGVPGGNAAPDSTDNSLTINLLAIPPYPSLPYVLSANQVAFVDTMVANEKYNGRRLTDYRITTPISAAQKRALQPRGYTMDAIGKLDRRISDLEYYVSFTLGELSVTRRTIPSSSDATIDRFKFGFFVDSFETTQYSDKSNPGYRASIIDGYLSPPVTVVNLPLQTGTPDPILLPYDEEVIVSQTIATSGPTVVTPVTPTDPGTGASNTYVQFTASVDCVNKTTSRSENAPFFFEEWDFTMSRTAGPVAIFMNCTDNDTALEILQSTDPTFATSTVAKTSADARVITSAEQRAGGRAYRIANRSRWELGPTLNRQVVGPVGFFINDGYALEFNHTPGSGLYYRIRVYKGIRRGDDAQAGTYAYRIYYPADRLVQSGPGITGTIGDIEITDPRDIAVVLTPYYRYDGTVTNSTDLISTVATDYSYVTGGGVAGYVGASVSEQQTSLPSKPGKSQEPQVLPPAEVPLYAVTEKAYPIVCTGLRPNTIHDFFFEGTNLSDRTIQSGGDFSTPLISDENGTLDFVFYSGSDITSPTTEIQQVAQLVSQPAIFSSFSINNSDSTSTAEGTIIPSSFVSREGFGFDATESEVLL